MTITVDPPQAWVKAASHIDWHPKGVWNLFLLGSRAEFMGLPDCYLPGGGVIEVRRSAGSEDLATRLWTVARALQGVGLVESAAAMILVAPDSAGGVDDFLAQALDATEESPLPDSEWQPIRKVLGDSLVTQLLDLSDASIRRYASGGRQTPQDAAERLHWLALVVADLAGSYNEFGIRRWFGRPRATLGGVSPLDAVGPGFDPDGEAAGRVRGLARTLTGLGAA